MKNINSKIAFPMHFWRTYSLIDIFKNSNYALNYKDKIIKIDYEGQEFEI